MPGGDEEEEEEEGHLIIIRFSSFPLFWIFFANLSVNDDVTNLHNRILVLPTLTVRWGACGWN